MPSDNDADKSLIGRQVAHYRITDLIGQGGMGEVYQAEDLKLHRTVAMKRVRAERLANAPEARRKLIQEARIASNLVHPYIASVFDVVDMDGDPLIVMEHLRGRPLNQLIGSDELPPDTMRALGLEIAEALSAIHEAGLVHCDIKPANVMVTADGHAKVMDFGLTGRNATILDPDADGNSPTVTASEEVVRKGTPMYMAPEQIRGLRPDHRTDLFALGIVLYEGLTGIHPFRRETLADTHAAILNDPPSGDDRVHSLTRTDPLGTIALKLLEKDPTQRYQLAADVVEQMKAAQTGATPIPARRPPVGIRTLGIAVFLTVVLAAGLAWLWNASSTHSQVAGRPAIAVLPLEDVTGEETGRMSRGPMVAGLMTARLGAFSTLRAVSQERIRELPASAGLSDTLAQFGEALPVRWVVTGRLFDEEGTLVATFEVHDVDSGETKSFSVSKPKAVHLAREAAVVLSRTLGVDEEPAEPSSPVESNSDEAQALYTRAGELLQTMEYAASLELAERAVKIDPGFIEGRLLAIELYDRLGYESKALDQVRQARTRARALGVAEESTTGLRLSARAAELTADREVAEQAYARLVARFPDDPEYLSALARIKHDGSEYAEAAALYEDGLLYDPLDPDLHLYRAGSLVLAGENVEAHREVREAERLCELFRIRGCAGRVSETDGRLLWADREFEQAAVAYGRSAEAFAAEGLTIRALLPLKSQADAELKLWRLGTGVDRLLSVVTRAREVGYDSLLVRTLNSLGAGRFRMRDLPAAGSALREAVHLAVRLDHRDWEHSAQVNLANVLLLSGDLDGAAAAVERSLELAREMSSSFREASSLLRQADVERKRGEDDRARATLDVILDTRLSGKQGAQLRRSVQQRRFWIELDAGDLPAALSAAEAAVEESMALGIDASVGYSLCLRSVANSRLGRGDPAGEDLAAAGRHLAGREQAPALADVAHLGRAWRAASLGDWKAVLQQGSSGSPTTEGARLALLEARAEIELGLRAEATLRLHGLIEAAHAPTAVVESARSLLSPPSD